ncbi:hypothetical protein [Parapedobacter koreensis]|uniref:Uncharacterized protein n=1 Tax=Parapedobacter koreensis TaxID=332977 RepID=A0A1H7F4B7_9SPHI|nr:hypothetical protein [Parapedobacter koreensis]SEK17985.1 hypothetical protein SAMN05421740_10158 [Parapedobacter koreensis]
MILSVNQAMIIEVEAKKLWNATDLEVSANQTYRFVAKGRWRDFIVKTGANGYTASYMRLFDGYKRFQNANWFSLIGSIDKSRDFEIGKTNTVEMKASGFLYLYANDAPRFYFNNSGKISVVITRIK